MEVFGHDCYPRKPLPCAGSVHGDGAENHTFNNTCTNNNKSEERHIKSLKQRIIMLTATDN